MSITYNQIATYTYENQTYEVNNKNETIHGTLKKYIYTCIRTDICVKIYIYICIYAYIYILKNVQGWVCIQLKNTSNLSLPLTRTLTETHLKILKIIKRMCIENSVT